MNQTNRNEEVTQRGPMTLERQATTLTRRRLLASGLAVGMSLGLAACASGTRGSSTAPSPVVTDGIFSPKLVLPIQDASMGGKTAIFNFVLPVG